MVVYVVTNRLLFNFTIHGIYEDETEALKEATVPVLPQGVIRRSVEEMEVIPKKGKR